MPSPTRSALDRLFQPRSIALVGATERSIWSIAAADNLKRFGFEGRVHMVNPKGGTIFGQQAATSCAAIGEPVDAALLMVPESKMLEVFDDLRVAQVGGVVILSSGFAETGEDGAQRQRAMADAARAAGIRIIGPNCLGFANFAAKTAIWTTPLRRPSGHASIALVSQSGALASQLEQFAYQQRVGLTHMISTGNEADLTVADAIAYLAQQPEPKAIALFLESVRNPAHFVAAVEAANAAGKPVVVLKVGTSEAAARAAQAHTGSLVGDDRVFDALCRRLALSRVQSLEELIVTTDLFARVPSVSPNSGFAIAAMSGGLCEIVTDQAEAEGIPLAALAPETLAALKNALPMASPSNPLDVTGAAMLDPTIMARTLAALARDPNVGAVAFTLDIPPKDDARGFTRQFLEQVAAGFGAGDKPCFLTSHTFSTVSGEARALAESLGIAYTGGGVRHALTAVGHWFRRSQRLAATQAPATTPSATGPRPVTEREVLDHLDAHGVAVIPAHLARTRAAAVSAASRFDEPVVLKIVSADIQHKTEVGGVALDLRDAAAVGRAWDTMMARVAREAPAARIDGAVVSPMRRSGVELFAGTLSDPQWGPAIAIGLGGVWIEALKDTSLRLLPITTADAHEMIGELRGAQLLDGFRGSAPVDREALARTIVAIGEAALALGPELVTLEVNPLLAQGARIEALDGLATWNTAAP